MKLRPPRWQAGFRILLKLKSPVHLNEVARRITTAVGVSRIGNRIRNKVKTAARQATRSGGVQIRGEFLYWTEQGEVTVRGPK